MERANSPVAFSIPTLSPRSFFVLARPSHWAKNFLVFLPLLATHAWSESIRWANASLTFFGFCFVASAGYYLNDIVDRNTDRIIFAKQHRPIACEEVSVSQALFVALLLLIVGLIAGRIVSVRVCVALMGYAALTATYSLAIKRQPIADVLALALLYSIRIAGGGIATHIPLSAWLIAFSIFLFFSLALLKRVSELKTHTPRGGYQSGDEVALQSFGTTSGYAAVLVLALYINGDTARQLYPRPQMLWALIPISLFWISRLWFLANRGEIGSDPVVFALKDKVNYWLLLPAVGAIWMATV